MSHCIGSDLCYWILTQSGKVLASTTVQHVTNDDAARTINVDGTKKGQAHKNPMFDTRAYLVEMADGSVNEYTANIIAPRLMLRGGHTPY